MNALQLWATGDSITQGNGIEDSQKYVSKLRRRLVKDSVVKFNNAVGGYVISNVVADSTTHIEPFYVTGQNMILLPWVGTNDLNAGTAVTMVESDYETYCAARKSEGWIVGAYTILPRSQTGFPAGFEADRQAFNTWLRANYTTFSTVLIDVAADSRIGDAGDELNTTYYNADRVHLVEGGNEVVAEVVYNALKSAGYVS